MHSDGRLGAAQEGLRQLELAALPTGKDWRIWWNEWKRHVEMKFAWERALIDAITRLVRNNLTMARQIRLESEAKRVVRYDSEGHVYGEETRSPAEITREALVWFLNVIKPVLLKPNDEPQPTVPIWAKILCKAVEGCYIQQARLGIELDGVKKKGYLTLNHSATAPNPAAFDERFTETL